MALNFSNILGMKWVSLRICPHHLTQKPRAAGARRPVEAIARDDQVDKTNRVRIGRAPFSYRLTFSVIFLSYKANARV